jgi:hypothetical protein
VPFSSARQLDTPCAAAAIQRVHVRFTRSLKIIVALPHSRAHHFALIAVRAAVSYVGGLLVNSSFVFLISWGTAVFWPIGFAIAVLYTAGLFAVGTYLRKRESPVPAINLLYLVGVVGVGASGMILAYNVTGCNSRSGSSSSSTSQDWVFDAVASNASTDVVAWAGLSRWRSDRSDATYAFVPSTGATYFRGRNGTSSHSEYLIRASAGVPPVLVSNAITSPSYLHLVGEPSSHLCFVGWSTSPISGVYNCDSRVYCCSIGTDCALSLAAVAPLAATAEPCNPTDLLVDAARLHGSHPRQLPRWLLRLLLGCDGFCSVVAGSSPSCHGGCCDCCSAVMASVQLSLVRVPHGRPASSGSRPTRRLASRVRAASCTASARRSRARPSPRAPSQPPTHRPRRPPLLAPRPPPPPHLVAATRSMLSV